MFRQSDVGIPYSGLAPPSSAPSMELEAHLGAKHNRNATGVSDLLSLSHLVVSIFQPFRFGSDPRYCNPLIPVNDRKNRRRTGPTAIFSIIHRTSRITVSGIASKTKWQEK